MYHYSEAPHLVAKCGQTETPDHELTDASVEILESDECCPKCRRIIEAEFAESDENWRNEARTEHLMLHGFRGLDD